MLLQEAADSGDYIELSEEEWDRLEQEALAEVQLSRSNAPKWLASLSAPGRAET